MLSINAQFVLLTECLIGSLIVWYLLCIMIHCYVTPGRGTKYCDEFVSLSFSLSIHSLNSKTTQLIFTEFLCMLLMAMARSYSDGVAILLSTSGFVDDITFSSHGPVGHSQAWRYILIRFARWQYQLDVRQLVFGRVHQNEAPVQSLLSAVALFGCATVSSLCEAVIYSLYIFSIGFVPVHVSHL